MIISPTTGTSFEGALLYIHKEHEKKLEENKKPKILEENFVFGSVVEQALLMQNVARDNARSSRPVLHLSINFHPDENISIPLRDIIFQRVLEEFGVDRDNHQFVIAQHFDANHEHYHILINKVGLDTKNINTNFIVNKSQIIADKLEKELNLKPTYGRTIVYDPDSEKGYRFTKDEERNKKKFLDKASNIKNTKEYIHKSIQEGLSEVSVDTVSDLQLYLQDRGIDMDPKFDNSNVLRGVSFRFNDQAYKGTAVGFKSKQIQNLLDQKSIKVETEKSIMVPKNSVGDDLKKKIGVVQNNIDIIKECDNKHKLVLRSIVSKVKEGEFNHDNLLPLYENLGFKLDNEKLLYSGYFISLEGELEWIKQTIKIVQESFKKYEEEKIHYSELMSTPMLNITIKDLLMGNKKEKELYNVQLQRKKDVARKPVVEFWGIEVSTGNSSKIQSDIFREHELLRKLEKEKSDKIRKEQLILKEKQAKQPLSNQHIQQYFEVIKKYEVSEDYVSNFLLDYEHQSDFKDLFWLDKKFESFELPDEKMDFLIETFKLDQTTAKILCQNFYKENVFNDKIELLNSLSDLWIRQEDFVVEKKNINRMKR